MIALAKERRTAFYLAIYAVVNLIAVLCGGKLFGDRIWLLPLILPSLIITTWVFFHKPEWFLFGLLVASTNIFSLSDTLDIPIGGDDIELRDILFWLTVMAVVIGYLTEENRSKYRSAVNLPLVIYLGIAVLNIPVSVYHGASTLRILIELETVLYCITFFLAIYLLYDRRLVLLLVKFILVIGAIVSVTTLITALPLPMREWILGIRKSVYQHQVYGGAYERVIPEAYCLILICFFIALLSLLNASTFKKRLGFMALVFIYSGTIIKSLARGIWFSVLVALGVAIVLMEWEAKVRVTLAILVLVVAFAVVEPLIASIFSTSSLVEAAKWRFTTISWSGPSQTDTVSIRLYESGLAIKKIAKNPVLGIGLGSRYYSRNLRGKMLPTFVHNGYLWTALKMGLPALGVFLWFCIAFLYNNHIEIRRVQDPVLKSIATSMFYAFAAMLILNNSSPVFMDPRSAVFPFMIVGINMALFRQEGTPDEPDTGMDV